MGWLDNLGGWEMILIVLVGLFIFGPDRLPKAIGDGVKMIRQLRAMARNATNDLSKELGTTIELEDLHPQTFLRKHILSEEDERAIRKPLESAYKTLREDLREVDKTAREVTDAVNGKPARRKTPKKLSSTTQSKPSSTVSTTAPTGSTAAVSLAKEETSLHVDLDAT